MGLPYEERGITVDEVAKAHADGTLEEAFGIGTAAIIAPIACIGYRGEDMSIATGAEKRSGEEVVHEVDGDTEGQGRGSVRVVDEGVVGDA